ncbi:MAG: ECF transporter S component [Anaerolineae bacterium]|nr:ECF transporter S component [Anaerolineae bacterium]
MKNIPAQQRRYYFTTRDLLIMAALAGLGGVVSIAVNALGDAIQAAVGFAGTTQWAAGLHVTFLLLAVGLVNKEGAGTITGLLKGGVELLTGSTHGVIILLVDLVAGLLVDLSLLPFRRKDSRWAYLLAGGLAAASNVFVFQLFASAPEDVIAFIWGFAALAFVSGALFGGLLAHALLLLLRRSGIVTARPTQTMVRWHYAIFLSVAVLLAIGGGFTLAKVLSGPPSVAITGDCAQPYTYYFKEGSFEIVQEEVELQGMKRRVEGVPLREILAQAQPNSSAGLVLVSASDGYSFFISLKEVEENPQLLLAHRGKGKELSYEIVGAKNSKAWVRNVVEIRLVPRALIEIKGQVAKPYTYDPDEWQLKMDNARLDLGEGPKKYQGSLLKQVLARAEPSAQAQTAKLVTREGQEVALPLSRALTDSSLRIWSVSSSQGLRFAIASEEGEVLAQDVVAIIIE